jgi:hypothetical protein
MPRYSQNVSMTAIEVSIDFMALPPVGNAARIAIGG